MGITLISRKKLGILKVILAESLTDLVRVGTKIVSDIQSLTVDEVFRTKSNEFTLVGNWGRMCFIYQL